MEFTSALEFTFSIQLSEPVEQSKTLVAVHNVTEDKLAKMLQYDGIPMPSIAATKAEM